MGMNRLENSLATIFGDYPIYPSEWAEVLEAYERETNYSQWSEIFGMYESDDKK